MCVCGGGEGVIPAGPAPRGRNGRGCLLVNSEEGS